MDGMRRQTKWERLMFERARAKDFLAAITEGMPRFTFIPTENGPV
jgi:hypothetical protein